MSHNVIVSTACSRIAAHPIIGHRWSDFFPTQYDAALSWLNYQTRDSKATLEKWFQQFDPDILLKKERSWRI